MSFRFQCQRTEALGQTNRWYCSQSHGRAIEDPELLWRYYIKSGGAEDFATRFDAAMSPLNQWYCSEFHHRPITDPALLWDYYMNWDKLAFGEHRPGLAESSVIAS